MPKNPLPNLSIPPHPPFLTRPVSLAHVQPGGFNASWVLIMLILQIKMFRQRAVDTLTRLFGKEGYGAGRLDTGRSEEDLIEAALPSMETKG